MRVRGTMAVCGLIGVILLGSGCGDLSDEAVVAATSSTIPTSVTLPDGPPPMSDTEYAMAMLEAAHSIGRAGPDRCWLALDRIDTKPDPATPLQVEMSDYVFSRWLNGLKAAYPDQAAGISTMSINLSLAAKASGYAVGFWDSDEALAVLADPDYVAARADYDAYIAANCSDTVDVGGTSTIPMP